MSAAPYCPIEDAIQLACFLPVLAGAALLPVVGPWALPLITAGVLASEIVYHLRLWAYDGRDDAPARPEWL